jgi:phosphatidylinositol dimannoside acyltransferase
VRPGETWRQSLAFEAYRCVAWLGRTLPERGGRRLFSAAGRLAFRALPGVRATVAANQAQVLGRPADDPIVVSATRQAFERYARYWFDTFHVMRLPDDEVQRRFRASGVEHVDEALAAGTGVVLVMPHMGNWDVGGRWIATRGDGVRLVSVAERLEPERLFELFLRHREELGMDIIGLDDHGVGQQLATALAGNRMVCLVADRDLSGKGVEVEMFGRARRVPAGPALLALSSGAPLLVVGIYEEGGDWRCVFGRPLEVERTGNRREDVRALTRAMAKGFEAAIAASPTDWHMFQPGWDP